MAMDANGSLLMHATPRHPFAGSVRLCSLRLRCIGLASSVLFASLPMDAIAKKADREQIMNYDAKSIDAYDAPNSITTLTGSVKITQGSLLITGDLAKIYLDGNSKMSRIVVTGNAAHIQQMDESNQLMAGDAAKLDYDVTNGIAVLTTKAVVNQQCRGEFHGDKLAYYMDTSQITGDSGGDGLVHGAIVPKQVASTPPVCAKPPTAQLVPSSEPVAGKAGVKSASRP